MCSYRRRAMMKQSLDKLKEFDQLDVDMIELRIDFYENIHTS